MQSRVQNLYNYIMMETLAWRKSQLTDCPAGEIFEILIFQNQCFLYKIAYLTSEILKIFASGGLFFHIKIIIFTHRLILLLHLWFVYAALEPTHPKHRKVNNSYNDTLTVEVVMLSIVVFKRMESINSPKLLENTQEVRRTLLIKFCFDFNELLFKKRTGRRLKKQRKR